MKRNHTGAVRGFHIYNEAWYSRLAAGAQMPREFPASIQIGMYHPEGGTSGEFQVIWMELAGKLTPQLRVFDDGWSALLRFGDLLGWMGLHDSDDPSAEKMAAAMRELGIKDLTERVSPSATPAEREYASWFSQGAAA